MISSLRTGRARIGAPDLMLAMVVVLVRLLASVAPMPGMPASPEAAALAALADGAAICHADGQDKPAHAPAHHDESCPLCPVFHLLSAAAILPSDASGSIADIVWRYAAPVALPPATGPPIAPVRLAQPRGPPALSV
jgi:hypothetical protein